VAVAVVVVAVFMHALSDLCVVGSATTVRLSRAKCAPRALAVWHWWHRKCGHAPQMALRPAVSVLCKLQCSCEELNERYK
jgi:hypothetical protein